MRLLGMPGFLGVAGQIFSPSMSRVAGGSPRSVSSTRTLNRGEPPLGSGRVSTTVPMSTVWAEGATSVNAGNSLTWLTHSANEDAPDPSNAIAETAMAAVRVRTSFIASSSA